mmetsp:Transcript_33377/g.37968  ORF Transcript_33377/g.37968 Transcript_33377/m.37968 type:complete len:348 (-) Transcript_33377:133-1176(-)
MSIKNQKKNREETRESVNQLITGPRPITEGPLLVSDIPPQEKGNKSNDGIILGIDEAGRGPVIGPMVYAAAYWNDNNDEIPSGYDDSKQMTAESRNKLFSATMDCKSIGFVIRVLHATEISQSMLRKVPYNLNNMSHDAAIQMIQCVLDAGVNVKKCYIDTVGREETYKDKLDRAFSDYGGSIEFIVEKKADAKYKPCSAASVLAKVTRDRIIENWTFTENGENKNGFESNIDFGSGYPSDPKCKKWMKENVKDPVFGYPDAVRFSWAPVKDTLSDENNNNVVKVEWEADKDEDDKDADAQRDLMASYIKGGNDDDGGSNKKKQPRLDYFQRLKLKRTTKLPTGIEY